jgi:Rod binding domain-containing protein
VDGIDGLTAPLLPLSPENLSPVLTAGAAAKDKTAEQLQKTARDFESVLLNRVFEEMRRTVPDSGLLESGTSDQVQGLFWMYMAQDVAAKGGIGLAKELTRQFARMQQGQSQQGQSQQGQSPDATPEVK